MSYQTRSPRKVSLSEILEQQRQERGLDPLPMEAELLIKRVSDGGHSGQYLADAFISAYRNTPFQHSLRDIIKLDAEAFRLFHEILHMRHVPGWSDDRLYHIEQQIIHILELSA